jgi:hypothetical protein
MARLNLWRVTIIENPTPKEIEEGGKNEDGRVLLCTDKPIQAATKELALIKAVQESKTEFPTHARVEVQVSPF